MYRPLPSFVTIGKSTIEGLGLIATDLIPAETAIGRIHFLCNGEICRTPLGAFGNHSDTPNCEKVEDENGWFIYALQDIEEGKEITWKYTLYKDFT